MAESKLFFTEKIFQKALRRKKPIASILVGKFLLQRVGFGVFFFTLDLNEFLFELKYNRRFRNLKFTIIEISFIGNSL